MADNVLVAPERAPAAGPPAHADAAPTAKEMSDARAEIARLTKTNGELSTSERFWSDRARAAEKDPSDEVVAPKVSTVDEEDYDDPVKFVEALSTKGSKAIAGYLKKAGYITKDEAADLAKKSADTAVGVARASMTADAELIGRHPDLKNAESELWKATAANLKRMVARDPRMKNSPGALDTAAELAALQIEAKGGGKGRAGDDDETEEPETAEERRQRRIDAQSGSRGRRSAATFADDDSENRVSGQAREIMEAMGVTEKDYVGERKKLKGSGR